MKTERTSDDLWTQRTLSTFQTFARGQDHKNLGGVPQTNTNGFHHSLNGNGHSGNSNGGTNGHGLGDRTSPHEEANGINIKNNGFGTTTTTIIINGSGSSNSPPLKSNGHGQGGQHHPSIPNKAKSVPVPVPILSPTNHHNHNHQHGHHRSLSVENNQNHMNHNSFTAPLPPPVHSHSLSYTSTDSDYNMSPFVLTDEDEQLLIVQVTLEKGDRRFGFSVIGGRDEGFPPCIDEISTVRHKMKKLEDQLRSMWKQFYYTGVDYLWKEEHLNVVLNETDSVFDQPVDIVCLKLIEAVLNIHSENMKNKAIRQMWKDNETQQLFDDDKSLSEKEEYDDSTFFEVSNDDIDAIIPTRASRQKLKTYLQALKSNQVYVCFLCNTGFKTSKLLIHHLTKSHQLGKSSKYICTHCNGIYQRKSFLRHLKNTIKLHSEYLSVNYQVEHELVEEAEECIAAVNEVNDEERNELKRLSMQFVASVLSTGKVPLLTTINIIKNAQQIFDFLITIMKTTAISAIESYETKQEQLKEFQDLEERFDNPLKDLDTIYKINKFLITSGNIIMPREIVLDSDIQCRETQNNPPQIYRPVTMQYVSITDTMKLLIKKPGFLKLLNRENSNQEVETYSHFRDGNFFKENFSKYEHIIFILIYFDEIEPANALGSKSGKHKLAQFYFTVLDLPNQFSSSVKNVYQIASLKSEDFKMCRPNVVLKPLIEELKLLWTEGLTCIFNGKEIKVKVAMAQLVGDNLGIHNLMGFSEGFTANYPCRRCKLHRDECKTAGQEIASSLRNEVNFAIDIASNDFKSTGVKFNSIINELPYHHTVKITTFDFMHDVLEGIAPDLIKHLTNYCISQDLITLETLNMRIESFRYGHHYSKSKPSPFKQSFLDGKTNANQNASQNLCLLVCFPLILGDQFSSEDRYWKLFLLLREIVDIILSPNISRYGVVHLRMLINEYLISYQSVTEKKLKPKHHHLTHYPSAILELGPLKQYWVMIFEAKHKFFKTVAHVSCNYKNIAKTVTYRNQLYTSFELMSYKKFRSVVLDVNKSDEHQIKDFEFHLILKSYFNLEDDDILTMASQVTLNSSVFRVDSFIMYRCDSTISNFDFGCIQNIVLHIKPTNKETAGASETYVLNGFDDDTEGNGANLVYVRDSEIAGTSAMTSENMTESFETSSNSNKDVVNKTSRVQNNVAYGIFPEGLVNENAKSTYNFNIEDVLKADGKTSRVLDKMSNSQFILREDRTAVAAVLVENLFNSLGPYPSKAALSCLATDLVQIYPKLGDPNEKDGAPEIWYYYSKNMAHSVGFLQERLQNTRKKYIASLNNLKATPVEKSVEDINADEGWESDEEKQDTTSEEDLRFLRCNFGDLVVSRMKETVMTRRQIIRQKPFHEIPAIMPRLFDTEGMVVQDFNVRHPKLVMNVYKYWPKMSKVLISFALQSGLSLKEKLGIEVGVTDLSEEQNCLLGFCLLPFLLPLCGRKPIDRKGDSSVNEEPDVAAGRKSSRKRKQSTDIIQPKILRSTVSSNYDTLSSVILFKTVQTNIKEVLLERNDSYPFIVALGSLNSLKVQQYFVVVCNVAVPCGVSFFQALDTCYKCFYVFGLCFPKEAHAIWTFIDHGLFLKKYRKGEISPPVKSLVGQIVPWVLKN